jgi:hypothetical protein
MANGAHHGAHGVLFLMTFAAPNLAEMIAKYQAFLAPEDPRFGEGIAGWTITSEYDDDPQSENGSGPIWGCMCSPSVLASDGKRVKLQPEDIAAKRAHIVVRTPKNRDELIEIERTVLHELGHVLHAKLDLPRDLEEEIMHSLDHFFSKLSPEQGQILARSFQNPMARAYRAKEGNVPDPIVEDKDKPDKEAPKMADGAPRDIATIEAEMLKTRLAGGDIAALQDEWFAAKMAVTAAAPIVEPAAPPVMGMKPEEAYARGQKAGEAAAESKAVKAYANTLKDLSAEQLAMVRECSTVESAERLVKVCVKPAQSANVIELAAHPSKKTKGLEDPLAREMAEAENDPVMRAALNIGSAENDGVLYDVPGRIIYIDGTENLRHHRTKHRAKREKAMGAA